MLRLREDELEWREIDEEVVILDGRTAEYLAVTGSGIVLWRLLADGASRDALVEALVQTYGIVTARAASDVDGFLALVTERCLLDQTVAVAA